MNKIEISDLVSRAICTGDAALMDVAIRETGAIPLGVLSRVVSNDQFELLQHIFRKWNDLIDPKERDSALLSAVDNKQMEMISFLLLNGANLNSRHGAFQNTPLVIAAQQRFTEVAELLLNAGADPNLQGTFLLNPSVTGLTALMESASRGNLALVKELLDRGADPFLTDQKGRTALDLARSSRTKEKDNIVRLLSSLVKSTPHPKPQSSPSTSKTKRPQAGNLSVDDLIQQIQSATNARPQPHPVVKGGSFFNVGITSRIASTKRLLEKTQNDCKTNALNFDHFLTISHFPPGRFGLSLFKAKDKFDAIAKMATNGGRYDISNADLLKFLRRLDGSHEFELIQCDVKSVGGRFVEPVTDPKGLAKSLQGFCPFVTSDYKDSVAKFAEHLKRHRTFLIWWD